MEVNYDTGRAFLVIVLTVIGVIFINLSIYYMVRNRSTIGQIDLLRKVSKQARNPWLGEDQALEELSKLVKSLEKDTQKPVEEIEKNNRESNG